MSPAAQASWHASSTGKQPQPVAEHPHGSSGFGHGVQTTTPKSQVTSCPSTHAPPEEREAQLGSAHPPDVHTWPPGQLAVIDVPRVSDSSLDARELRRHDAAM